MKRRSGQKRTFDWLRAAEAEANKANEANEAKRGKRKDHIGERSVCWSMEDTRIARKK